MHIGLIAAKVPVDELRKAFLRTWNEYEIKASDTVDDDGDLWDWKAAHEVFVSEANWSPTNRGTTVFAFRQDGDWAIMMDWSYVLAMDHEKLPVLSGHVGTVVTLVVESASGSAYFSCYEGGQLRREINNADGEVTFKGRPLPEENGLDIDRFYMEESEALWKALGLSPLDRIPTQGLRAVCVVDRTDFSRSSPVAAAGGGASPVPPAQAASPGPKRPWWKFW